MSCILSLLFFTYGYACSQNCVSGAESVRSYLENIYVTDQDIAYGYTRTIGSDHNMGSYPITVTYHYESQSGSGWEGSVSSYWLDINHSKFSLEINSISRQWDIPPNVLLVVSSLDWSQVEVYEGDVYQLYWCPIHAKYFSVSINRQDWASWKTVGTNIDAAYLY